MVGRPLKSSAAAVAASCLILSPHLDVQAAVTLNTHALAGNTAPGTEPGLVFSSFGLPVLDNAGNTAFIGRLAGPGLNGSSDRGIWSGHQAGSVSLVARRGDPAPGTEPGVVFSSLHTPTLNGPGQISFRGHLIGPGVNLSRNKGVWVGTPSSLAPVARANDPAPGTEPGVEFDIFSFSSTDNTLLNDNGQAAFWSQLVGPGVDTSNRRGLWTHASGSTELIVRGGDPVPGADPGVVFTSPTRNNFVINNTGQVVFSTGLTGPGVGLSNSSSIWSKSVGSTLQLVARDGDPAPGAGPGMVYGRGPFPSIESVIGPFINDAGQIAFRKSVIPAGSSGSGDNGIWLGAAGSMQLLALVGNDAPGTEPGVTYQDLTSDPVLNGAGQVVFSGRLIGPGIDATNDRGIWLGTDSSLDLFARNGDPAPLGPGFTFLGLGEPMINDAGQVAFIGGLAGPGVNTTNDFALWATDPDGTLQLVARENDVIDVNDDPLVDDLRTILTIQLADASGTQDGRGTPFNNAGQLALHLGFTDGSQGIFIATVPEPGSLVMTVVGATLALRRRG